DGRWRLSPQTKSATNGGSRSMNAPRPASAVGDVPQCTQLSDVQAEPRPGGAAPRAQRLADSERQSLSAGQVLSGEEFAHKLGGLGRGLADLDACRFEGFLLRGSGSRGTGDDGAGVAHGLALGRGEAGDVADDRLGHVVLDEGCGALFGVAADLADHDDGFGVRVGLEGFESIDVRGADDRVSADADGGREAEVTQL